MKLFKKLLAVAMVAVLALTVLTGCKVEPRMRDIAAAYDKTEKKGKTAPSFQFMRLGYFCLDNRDSTADILNLKKKVDAGADYIITQMFFDNSVFYSYVEKCRKAGINVPIIPGLKPISTARQVALLPQSFSLDIPKELTEAIAQAGDDKEEVYRIGTQWCAAQCKDLLAHGVPAVHFYTMGKPRNITEIMRECF